MIKQQDKKQKMRKKGEKEKVMIRQISARRSLIGLQYKRQHAVSQSTLRKPQVTCAGLQQLGLVDSRNSRLEEAQRFLVSAP